MRYFILLTYCAVELVGQSASAPRLGWALDGSRAVELWGVPGAARRGAGVELGAESVMLNPAKGAALIVRDGSAGVISLPGGAFQPLAPVLPAAAPDAAAFSASGTALVLVSRGELSVFTWTPSGEWTRQWQLSGTAAGAAAVSDDGQYVLTRVNHALRLWTAEGAQLVSENAGAFTFGRGPEFVFSEGAGLVFGNPRFEFHRVALDHEGVQLAPVADGFVSVLGGHVETWRANGERLNALECTCESTALTAAGDGWVRLAGGDGGPLWMTDGRQVFFVPAAAEKVEEGN